MAKMILGGKQVGAGEEFPVVNPFDGSVLDTVPAAGAAEIEMALELAVSGAKILRQTTGYQRSLWLDAAGRRLQEQSEPLAELISKEEGKILAEARHEVQRAIATIELSAEEAKRIQGQMVPLEGSASGANKIGFTMRVPCGVVVAITPFNFPLNLVAHKVGPALAAGNAVILKPASDTPLSALRLVEILLESGFPPPAVGCLTGSGRAIGEALCRDARVRKISFTGSHEVGEAICRAAGVKRVTMELGSNAPLIIIADADLEKVVDATIATGYSNAGQVCISTQRVLVESARHGDYLDLLRAKVAKLRTGNPLDPGVAVGPMIRRAEAERVVEWIAEAAGQGADILVGGERHGSIVTPAVLANVKPMMRVARDELFGPAVCVAKFDHIDEAIAAANDSRYGLAAGIFTENLGWAMRFLREVEAGNLHVNWGPQWRADLMPYGGLKDSGFGKEGPAHAIREMTEEKMAVIHL